MPLNGQSSTSLLELDELFDHTDIEPNAARSLSSLSNTSSVASSSHAFEDSKTLSSVGPVYESFGGGHFMRGNNSRQVAPYTTQSQHLLARSGAVYSNCTMDQPRMMAQHTFAQPAFLPPRFFPNNSSTFNDNAYLRQSFRPVGQFARGGAVSFPGKSSLPFAFPSPTSFGYPYGNQQMPQMSAGRLARPSDQRVSGSSLANGHGRGFSHASNSHARLDAFLKPRPPHSRDIVVKYILRFCTIFIQNF